MMPVVMEHPLESRDSSQIYQAQIFLFILVVILVEKQILVAKKHFFFFKKWPNNGLKEGRNC